MILYTRITADGKVYNVQEHVNCQTCGGTAERDSDVELDPHGEKEQYIAFYQCENHHYTKAVVELHE